MTRFPAASRNRLSAAKRSLYSGRSIVSDARFSPSATLPICRKSKKSPARINSTGPSAAAKLHEKSLELFRRLEPVATRVPPDMGIGDEDDQRIVGQLDHLPETLLDKHPGAGNGPKIQGISNHLHVPLLRHLLDSSMVVDLTEVCDPEQIRSTKNTGNQDSTGQPGALIKDTPIESAKTSGMANTRSSLYLRCRASMRRVSIKLWGARGVSPHPCQSQFGNGNVGGVNDHSHLLVLKTAEEGCRERQQLDPHQKEQVEHERLRS